MKNTSGSAFVNIIVNMANRKISEKFDDDFDKKMELVASIKREYKLLNTFVSLV